MIKSVKEYIKSQIEQAIDSSPNDYNAGIIAGLERVEAFINGMEKQAAELKSKPMFSVRQSGALWEVINPFGISVLPFMTEQAAKQAADTMNGVKK